MYGCWHNHFVTYGVLSAIIEEVPLETAVVSDAIGTTVASACSMKASWGPTVVEETRLNEAPTTCGARGAIVAWGWGCSSKT